MVRREVWNLEGLQLRRSGSEVESKGVLSNTVFYAVPSSCNKQSLFIAPGDLPLSLI